MTVSSQPGGGSARYRQSPDDARIVEVQRTPGARWRIVAVFSEAEDARAFVMQLGRKGEAKP